MPNVHDAYPSKYLRAADLNGGSMIVKIIDAVIESIGLEKERKLVLLLEGGKQLVLNKTNARYIASHYGDDTEGWKNKEIELYVTPVDFQGRTFDSIRVRIPPRAPNAVATRSA
jgi:hypothetical protein